MPTPRWSLLLLGLAALVRPSPAAASPATTSDTEVVTRWTGIDLASLDWLNPPRPDGYTSGFTADFKGGLVRVYVMPSPQAASWWVARMVEVLEKQAPKEVPLPLETEAHEPPGAPPDPSPSGPRLSSSQELLRSGDSLVIARMDNVALAVEVASGAERRAELVLAALTDQPSPWPPVPVLERAGAGWTVSPPDEVVVRYEGGTLGPGPGLRFQIPPRRLIVYDTSGRSSRQAYDPMGLPIDDAMPWDNHALYQRQPLPRTSK